MPQWAMPADGTIFLVEVKYGLYLNQIIFHYTSAGNGEGAITLGGYDPGSSHAQFELAKGEQIRTLKGRYGTYVDSLQIVTSLHTYPASGSYGGPGGGTPYTFNVPLKGQLAGVFGRAGAWIDALGVVYLVPQLITPPPVQVVSQGNIAH